MGLGHLRYGGRLAYVKLCTHASSPRQDAWLILRTVSKLMACSRSNNAFCKVYINTNANRRVDEAASTGSGNQITVSKEKLQAKSL